MTPVLAFAKGVTLVSPPTPGGSRILGTAEYFARQIGTTVTVTSGSDSHPPDDPHTLGNAFDFETIDLTAAQLVSLYQGLKTDLGPDFYVQYEVPALEAADPTLRSEAVVNAVATGPHIHVQVSKGTTYPGP